MVVEIARPKLEGNIAVGEDRQIGFAEFGDPQGRAVFWLHGTPGARRQIPIEARVYAEEPPHPPDRPGSARDRLVDAPPVREHPGVRRRPADDRRHARHRQDGGDRPVRRRSVRACFRRGAVRSRGGGRGARRRRALPRRRRDHQRPDEPGQAGGAAAEAGRRPAADRREPGGPGDPAGRDHRADSSTRRHRPKADRHLLTRPEFGAMFLDDLLNGSRKQLAAPFNDVILFTRDWGFRLDEVKVPVRWWHGDSDHIVPFAHGEHVVSRLPDAELFVLPGESHLAGLGRGEEILSTLMKIWDEQDDESSRRPGNLLTCCWLPESLGRHRHRYRRRGAHRRRDAEPQRPGRCRDVGGRAGRRRGPGCGPGHADRVDGAGGHRLPDRRCAVRPGARRCRRGRTPAHAHRLRGAGLAGAGARRARRAAAHPGAVARPLLAPLSRAVARGHRDDHLHLGHHRAAQGRGAEPARDRRRPGRAGARPGSGRPTTSWCMGCRCFTCTGWCWACSGRCGSEIASCTPENRHRPGYAQACSEAGRHVVFRGPHGVVAGGGRRGGRAGAAAGAAPGVRKRAAAGAGVRPAGRADRTPAHRTLRRLGIADHHLDARRRRATRGLGGPAAGRRADQAGRRRTAARCRTTGKPSADFRFAGR